MSETVARQRPSMDLDDFERHLQTQRHHEDDPLAELARIVGDQPDPYHDVFAQHPAGEPAAFRPSFEPHHRQEPSLGGATPRFADFAAIEAGLRATAAQQAHQSPQAYAQPAQDPRAPYDDVEPPLGAAINPGRAEPPRARASKGGRRPIYAVAASIAVAVVGIGVAFAYKGTGSSPREIRTITAAAGPTKIQPPADASADQDANASGQQATPTKLVSREEQPVDLAQAVQDNAARDAASRGSDAASVPVPLSPAQASGSSYPDYSAIGGDKASPDAAGTANPSYGDQGFGVGMPKPKRVKSVSVRPDGSIVREDAPEAKPFDASVTPVKANDRAGPVAGLATPANSTPKSSARASARSATRVASATQPTADDGADAPAPQPAKPAKKAKPVRVASAETGAQETSDATDETKPAGAGAFAVQLAAPGSESDARSATTRLLKKYNSALHGRRLGFHRAESNGHTVYRVRVSSLTKEDATSLCGKLKADGGTCFVARD